VFTGGHTYSSSQALYSVGALWVSIGNFTLANGTSVFNSGHIRVSPPSPTGGGQVPFGAGQNIYLNNTSLIFDLRAGTQTVTFDYLDYGGTINFGISGSAPYVGYMSNLPTSIGGATIKKYNVADLRNPQGAKVAERGTITMNHTQNVGGMRVGGQELYVDNFCFN
jgi:hypothetical protein